MTQLRQRRRPARLAVLAAAWASLPALAATESVEFDAALTNSANAARWEYRAGFEYVKTHSAYGFAKKAEGGEGQVVSPLFDFSITSVVLHAEKATTSTTRNLVCRPTSGKAGDAAVELVDGIVPAEQTAFTSRWEWAQSERVRSFSLMTTRGTGIVYLKSAEISGVYVCPTPRDVVAADVQGTRFTLVWTGDGAASNRVDVSTRAFFPAEGVLETNLDFAAFSNDGGNSKAVDGDFYGAYPELSGTFLYFPAHSQGQLQLSTGSDKGVLVHEGLEDYGELTLRIVARRYDHKDEADEMSVSFVDGAGGSTNPVCSVHLEYHFTTNYFSLSSVSRGARLLFNADGKKGNHRVIIDELGFVRGYVPEREETLAMRHFAVGRSRIRIGGLGPNTAYVATVTAFDAEGNPSEPSAPVEILTGSSNREAVLTIR